MAGVDATGLTLLIVHLATVVTSVLVVAGNEPWRWHRACMLTFGASSAHRVFQRRWPEFERSMKFFDSCVAEDAFHNLVFALIFYFERPSAMSVTPPAVYAFFKLLVLAAQMFPSFEGRVGAFVKGRGGEKNPDGTTEPTRMDSAFRFVAKIELLLFAVVWSRALFSMSLRAANTAMMYSLFVALRYQSIRNPRSRQAWATVRVNVEALAASPRCPAVVSRAIGWLLSKVDAVAEVARQRAQAHAQQQQQQQQQQ